MLGIFSALPCRLDDTLLTVTWMSWPLFFSFELSSVMRTLADLHRLDLARACLWWVGSSWVLSAGRRQQDRTWGKKEPPTPVLDVCIFFILWLLYCWQGAYPARLKKVLVVTAPLWFKAPFKILRLFVREKLRDRVYTVSLPQVRMKWRRWEIERELLFAWVPVRYVLDSFSLSVWTMRENDYGRAQLDMRSQTFRSREFMSLFSCYCIDSFFFLS